RALERRELAGVSDDPGRLARIGPRAVRNHELPGARAHDQRVDGGVEVDVVVLRAGQCLQERELVLRPGDPSVDAERGEVDDRRRTIAAMDERVVSNRAGALSDHSLWRL